MDLLSIRGLLVLGSVAAFVACSGSDGAVQDPTDTPASSLTGSDAGAGKDSGIARPASDASFGSNAPDAASSACVSDEAKASLTKRPVDIIVIVDTSPSMNPASSAVESNINDNLATVLTTANIDYRVILLAAYGSGAAVCIGPPLGGAPCTPYPPAKPANTDRFFHYGANTGSGALLSSFIDWYSKPDPYGLAPNGYSQWLRPGARKVFLAFSDTSSGSYITGAQFDSQLLALDPAMFGTSSARNYVFHSIVGLRQNSPATSPWLPTDPLVNGVCTGYSGYLGAGPEEQKVSILSGGLRFPICQSSSFDVVFQQIASSVVTLTPISCDLPFPQPPAGKTLDPNTIQLDYHPGSGGAAQTFAQVVDSSKCSATSFYVDGSTIHLCPQACSAVSTDSTGSVDVRYGCDVGFVK